MSEYDRRSCICCGKRVEGDVDISENNPLSISPVYGGLIFRSTGNYGSKIFDPIPQGEEMLAWGSI